MEHFSDALNMAAGRGPTGPSARAPPKRARGVSELGGVLRGGVRAPTRATSRAPGQTLRPTRSSCPH